MEQRVLTASSPPIDPKRRADSRYPSDDELVRLMAKYQSFNKVAEHIGLKRESLKDFLRIRPNLKARMDEHRRKKLTPEQARENNSRSKREHARRYRAANPDEARRKRREQMNSYGPEYRQKWNHYNRLRRLELNKPDELAEEYCLILRNDPCVYCGKPMKEIDHIQPLALNGTGKWDNLTASCQSCNRRKNDTPLLLFMLRR